MGRKTLFNDVIETIGAVNLASTLKSDKWIKISAEQLLTLNPDFIIAGGEPSKQGEILALIKDQPGWRNMMAVKKGRIIVVPERLFFSASHKILDLIGELYSKLIVEI